MFQSQFSILATTLSTLFVTIFSIWIYHGVCRDGWLFIRINEHVSFLSVNVIRIHFSSFTFILQILNHFFNGMCNPIDIKVLRGDFLHCNKFGNISKGKKRPNYYLWYRIRLQTSWILLIIRHTIIWNIKKKYVVNITRFACSSVVRV